MNFKNYLRDMAKKENYSIFSIFRDTFNFLNRNMFFLICVIALILALFPTLFGVTGSRVGTFFNDGKIDVDFSNKIYDIIYIFLEPVLYTIFLVLFLRKANNSDVVQGQMVNAILKVVLLTLLASILAFLIGGVLAILSAMFRFFIYFAVFLVYVITVAAKTVENSICEEPNRKFSDSAKIGLETFFDRGFLIKVTLMTIITMIFFIAFDYIMSAAIGKGGIDSIRGIDNISSRIIIFIYYFLTKLVGLYFHMSIASLYMIHSEGESFEEGDDARLKELLNTIDDNEEKKNKREMVNNFFEEYNKNVYKGKDEN